MHKLLGVAHKLLGVQVCLFLYEKIISEALMFLRVVCLHILCIYDFTDIRTTSALVNFTCEDIFDLATYNRSSSFLKYSCKVNPFLDIFWLTESFDVFFFNSEFNYCLVITASIINRLHEVNVLREINNL